MHAGASYWLTQNKMGYFNAFKFCTSSSIATKRALLQYRNVSCTKSIVCPEIYIYDQHLEENQQKLSLEHFEHSLCYQCFEELLT